jgi:transaldolase
VLSDLRIKLFADGADLGDILELSANPLISGFTTNPTLMRKAGVTDYESFARRVLEAVPDRPVSLEVFADDFAEIEAQALRISSWGDHVYVKIPVMNPDGEPSNDLLRRLAFAGVKVNVTAVMTVTQVEAVRHALAEGPRSFVSLFAGRIADTGRDPVPMVSDALVLLSETPQLSLVWASPRELLNIFQADAVGCHVITATSDILRKLPFVGKDLSEFSLETVRMFHADAQAAGYTLDPEDSELTPLGSAAAPTRAP